jgi:hypothetical protein
MVTPTPIPAGTPAIDFSGLQGIDSDMAVEAVQFWNTLGGIGQAIQIALLLMVIFGGITVIVNTTRKI